MCESERARYQWMDSHIRLNSSPDPQVPQVPQVLGSRRILEAGWEVRSSDGVLVLQAILRHSNSAGFGIRLCSAESSG